VHSFSDERKVFTDVPIGMITTAWADQQNGEVIVLVMNKALYFGNHLEHTLICPNQLHSFGIVVDNTSKQFNPKSTHPIAAVPGDNNLTIQLEMNGVISYLSSHKLSKDELENCRHITLTSNIPFDPNDPSWEMQEK
jgi:hypothetical protein